MTDRGSGSSPGKGLEKPVLEDRLTISLAPGQRAALQAVADHNQVTLAYVVRYAIAQLIADHRETQLRLVFPDDL